MPPSPIGESPSPSLASLRAFVAAFAESGAATTPPLAPRPPIPFGGSTITFFPEMPNNAAGPVAETAGPTAAFANAARETAAHAAATPNPQNRHARFIEFVSVSCARPAPTDGSGNGECSGRLERATTG
ncbi:hypothetical protein [Burkholderia savannae]|uniref:hypothetical protein n=1 Tax=Burkholderia savannae TaxID=1637837 RepID=UPI0012E3810E|nr:hypothetical protein [Burkholderia savannae]